METKTISKIFAFFAISFFIIPMIVAPVIAHTVDDPLIVDLIADGRDNPIEVGDVIVYNTNSTLIINYTMAEGYYLNETHLHIDVIESGDYNNLGVPVPGDDDIPQTKKNNPIPGQFDYCKEHDAKLDGTLGNGITEYTIEIDLGEMSWVVDTELYIAAHAVVIQTELVEVQEPVYDVDGNIIGYETVIKEQISYDETAWAEGYNFPGKNWATYFTYTVQNVPLE